MKCFNCRGSFEENKSKHAPFCCKGCKLECKKDTTKFKEERDKKKKIALCSKFALTDAKQASKNRNLVYKDFKSKAGYYRKYKKEYKDKIVDYPESPNGKGYIGIAKKPLMKIKDGHGYQGVLMQDETRRYVQCASCGKWMKKIAISHLRKCGFKDVIEYKDKYGLNHTTGLVSDETSLKLTKAALKNKQSVALMNALQKKGFNGGNMRSKDSRSSMQFKNMHGSCPEQVRHRLYEFIKCNRELPTQRNRGRSLYKLLISRFGSFGDGLKALGLPHFKRRGTNMVYTFPDWTIYKYNINQFYDREKLFNMMMQKCPVLQ